MDTRKLQYFLAVVDHGGFGKAAEHLFMAQPSLSQAVASLEQSLGVPLFHRIGRQAVLSEAGKALIGPARVVMRDLDAAEAAALALRDVQSGVIDLVTMPSPGIEPLAPLIADFTSRHPRIRLNVNAAFTPDEVIESVRTGDSEIGLVGSPDRLCVPGVNVLELQRQPFILIVNPAADKFGDNATICRDDLAGERLIASQRGSLMRSFVDDTLAHGVDSTIVVEVAHRTSILPLVLAGVGHAVLPAAWAPLARRSGLRTLSIDSAPYLDVALLSRDRDLTTAAQSFLEMAASHLGELSEIPAPHSID